MKRKHSPSSPDKPTIAPSRVIDELRVRFQQHGCFRAPDLQRRKNDSRGYKKGYEVRLVAQDRKDLARLRRLLKAAGFKAGKAYPKHSQLIQPVYGRDALLRFRSLID